MTVATVEREVSKIIADLLAEELGLDSKHCLLGDQKYDIPADEQLFVVVFFTSSPPIGAGSYLDTDAESNTFGKEIQQVSVLHDCRIEAMSYSNAARVRQMEPAMALTGLRAQQLAEKYGIQINRPSAPVDASDTEVTGRLQRFVTHCKITALHQKVKNPPSADYFDKFNGEAAASEDPPPPSVTTEQ